MRLNELLENTVNLHDIISTISSILQTGQGDGDLDRYHEKELHTLLDPLDSKTKALAYTVFYEIYGTDEALDGEISFMKQLCSPDTTNIKDMLANNLFINSPYYDRFVKEHFANNSVIMNKWLRYAKNMRELG
jgi:hypothetical protein